MKKTVLIFILISIPALIFGSTTTDPVTWNEHANQDITKPVLHVKGTKVFNENTLLKKSEVINLLQITPVMAKKFKKGTDMRSSGILLIFLGAATMTGGIVLAVSGVETKTSDQFYYSYTYTDFSDNYYIGLVIATIGELMLDGGIAYSIVGKINIKRAVSGYNTAIRKSGYFPGGLNYQLGLLNNGKIGVRVNF